MSGRIVAEDSSFTFDFNTRRFSTGAPYTLAGTPSMYARVNGGDTEVTSGLTLTADADGKTGQNKVAVDLSASASYTAGAFIEFFIAAGTVDSVSVADVKVYEVLTGTNGSIDQAITRLLLALPAVAAGANNGLPLGDASGDVTVGGYASGQAPLQPTVAGRTLDVTTTGAGGIDWGNVENQSTAVNLSATNIDPDQVVASVTGNVVGSVGSVTAGVTLADGAHGGTSAVITLGQFRIDSSSADAAFYITNTVGDGIGVMTDVGDAVDLFYTGASSSRLRLGLSNTAISAVGAVNFQNAVNLGSSVTAGANSIPWNSAWDTEVQSEVQDAIEANNLDHIAGTATGIPSIPAGTYIDQMMDDGTTVYDRTTDSLQAIRDRGDSAWTTATGFSTLDAAGVRAAVGMASANLDTQLAAIPTTIRLKKNTAFSGFAFPMLDTSGDPATGLTVSGQVSKDGAAFGNLTNAVSEIASGAYKVDLAAGDTNGNDLLFKFNATGAKTLFVKVIAQV